MKRIKAVGHVAGRPVGIIVGLINGRDATTDGFDSQPWITGWSGTANLNGTFEPGGEFWSGRIKFRRLTPRTVVVYAHQHDGFTVR